MDLSKYDIEKQKAPPQFNNWKESLPVVLLSDAIKITGKKYGIGLHVDDDMRPTLCFTPGINAGDIGSERWSVAYQVVEYFLAAIDDLNELIASGQLNLSAVPNRRKL
jgi:hypothetical protein